MIRSLSDLEREIALLTWNLRMRRMTPAERAAYHGWLISQVPATGLERRVEDLITELRLW